MTTQLIGKVLANRYEILARVGEGGMAVVYRAKDTLLRRMVAVKVLHPQYANDVEFIERFKREAQTAASLSHPNVVNIYDVGRDGDTNYIVMEYVEGRNLKDIIRQEGPLSWRTAVFIAIEICRALEAAHRHNLTHRDVKPHNILITRQDGSVKVTDFGIARANATSSLTHTGTVMGSVHYISPEQARGDAVGATADLYSLGVVLYEMVTGRVPFTGESPVAIALKHLQEQPESPRSINPAVPIEVEHIINRAMGKTIAERYPTAGAMLRDLRAVLNEPGQSEVSDDAVTQPLSPIKPAPGNLAAPQPKRCGTGGKWVLAVIILSFAAGLIWAGQPLTNSLFGQGETVSVPSVVGRSFEDASSVLKQAGFRVTKQEDYSSSVKANLVISQDPEGNTRAKKNQAVVLTVSRGPELLVVPDVIGLEANEAQANVQAAGLKVGSIKEEDKQGSSGIVLRQTPAGGSRLARDGQVDLVISKTSIISAQVTVPDLHGLTVDVAKKRLVEVGLKLGSSYDEENEVREPGTIIDQSVPAGSQAAAGTAVDVVYARQPLTRTVNISVNVPAGGTHEVKVNVIDELGERNVFNERRAGGSTFIVSVKVRTTAGTRKYRIYFDGKLADEGNL